MTAPASAATLRDWLACQAPPVNKTWAALELNKEKPPERRTGTMALAGWKDLIELEPRWRYQWADRMLAERGACEGKDG